MSTIKFFDNLHLRDHHPYGYKATFNPTYTEGSGAKSTWTSPYHFGINQGLVVLMIENYRSGLLWDLMRKSPYIVEGLRRAGFTGGWMSK